MSQVELEERVASSQRGALGTLRARPCVRLRS
jgi:hypothetical protein